MVLSMTGYGKATGSFEGKKITIEIRSLNSKSLDLNMRMSSIYREKELDFRAIISEHLDRGKVEVSINTENTGDSQSHSINRELALAYFNDIKSVGELVGQQPTDILSIVLRMPEIYSAEREKLSKEEGDFLCQLVTEACADLNTFRKQEGDQLRTDFTSNVERINELLLLVPPYETARIDIVRERMRAGLEKISSMPIDSNRFEQELIFYIEKMDISEEKMRLSNHLNFFIETMDVPQCGKKLGFITQEIGREVNTLGSKSYHVELQKIVVEMKDHLEKIKEQVLNTL